MYKKGLALNDLQLLICNKTKPDFHQWKIAGQTRLFNLVRAISLGE